MSASYHGRDEIGNSAKVTHDESTSKAKGGCHTANLNLHL